MSKEWQGICKDCGEAFIYSDALDRQRAARGQSRSDRCQKHRVLHKRAMQGAGTAYFFDTPPLNNPPRPGRLGKVAHEPPQHTPIERVMERDSRSFGITPDDIRRVYEALTTKQVLVVVGPTGSGKSTYLPACLVLPPPDLGLDPDQFTRNGQIYVTQPRIEATRTIPEFVARLLGTSFGAESEVGFRHSQNKSRGGNANRLTFQTDGTLINIIAKGELDRLSLIMIDEAHERSLNIDLILGLLKQKLPAYPRLRLIIASATINAERFLAYFGGPDKGEILTFKGQTHQVRHFVRDRSGQWIRGSQEMKENNNDARESPEAVKRRLLDSDSLIKNVVGTCVELIQKVVARHPDPEGNPYKEGDILAFVPGTAEIDKVVDLIRRALFPREDLRGVDVLPLHAQLLESARDRALMKKHDAVTNRLKEYLLTRADLEDLALCLPDNNSVNKALESVAKLCGDNPEWNAYEIVPLQQSDPFPPYKTDSKPKIFLVPYEYQHLDRFRQEGIRRIIDRRIIVATNVAETSLTVEGIVYVVDTGAILEEGWSPGAAVKGIGRKLHSRAGCRQRWGRAGRIRPGQAYCLYTEQEFLTYFQPFSTPQFKRACLDDVILSAKMAGVTDVVHFDWMESPLDKPDSTVVAELERAEESLKNRSALDDEGDPTPHAEDLRNCGQTIQIGELIILADRFGCAVEMCTLAPMLACTKLTRSLLRWDDCWDVETRLAVQRVQGSLRSGCADDLEFCLKIYQAWEDAATWEGGRQAWADTFKVNHVFIEETVYRSRESLIDSLSTHKKESERRPLDFSLLDRLRLILARGLKRQVYERSGESYHCKSGGPNAVIRKESLLYGKNPDAFVAYHRALRPKDDRVNVAMLIRLESGWLPRMDQADSDLKFARLLDAITRESHLAGAQTWVPARLRLMVEQYYPLDWQFHAEVESIDSDAVWLRLGEKADSAMQVPEIVEADQYDLIHQEREDASQDQPTGSKIRVEAGDPEADAGLPEYLINDEATSISSLLLRDGTPREESRDEPMRARLQGVPADTLAIGQSLTVEVQGYGQSPTGQPIVLVGVPAQNSFEAFAQRYSAGDTVTVVPVEVKSENDKHWLQVREPETGLVVAMDSKYLGFNPCLQICQEAKKVKNFEVVVEGVDRQHRRVQLSRLPFVERDLEVRMRSEGWNGYAIPGTGKGGSNDEVFWILWRPKDGIVHGAFYPLTVHQKNQMYRPGFVGYPNNSQVFFGRLPEGLERLLERAPWNTRFRWDAQELRLVTTEPMRYTERALLMAQCEEPWYQCAIDELYRRSNQLQIKFPKRPVGTKIEPGVVVPGTVLSVGPASVRVAVDLEGVEVEAVIVRRGHVDWRAIEDARHVVQPNEQIQVVVQGPTADGRAVRVRRMAEDDPITKYQVGQRIRGKATDVRSDGVVIDVEQRVQGLVPQTQVSWYKVNDLRRFVQKGREYQLEVTKVDVGTRLLTLTMRLAEEDPQRKYLPGTRVKGRVCNLETYGAFIQLETGERGLLHVKEMNMGHVRDVRNALPIGQELDLWIRGVEGDPRKIQLTRIDPQGAKVPRRR